MKNISKGWVEDNEEQVHESYELTRGLLALAH